MKTTARRTRFVLLAFGLWTVPPGASAQPSDPPAAAPAETKTDSVTWRPHFRRAGPWDAAVIGVAGALNLTEALLPRRSGHPLWEGPILWDRALRDLLVLDSREQREVAGTVGDVMMAGSMVHSMVVDNLIVAWGVHGESEVALQMSVANAEAYSFSFALVSWVKRLTGRARPYAAECETDPEYSSDCNSGRKYRSFYSGHATSTAVGAGLLCAHHLHLPLYGYPELDTGVCAAGIALTLTTCALRIASDNHWTSDVAVGHLVGFASGYLIPTLFFYRFDLLGKGGKPPERVWAPWLGPHSVGLRVWGGL